MNDIAISLKNVSKYYKLYNSPQDRLKESLSFSDKEYHKKFYATKNLNLEIKKGEIIGIVGKNGSGKSTLLKLITGVLTPDEGSIKVKGKISALLELGSGFNPEFTGMQNIFFYGTILGFSKKEMEEKLDDILAFADIGEFIDQPLKTYSSGMKSRLGFAVAVHIEPEILILDEVLAVGDVLFKRKCYAKMEEFFKGGKTILYVSHDANSVKELCTRAIFLEAGNILLDSDAKTVSTYYEKYLFAKDENIEKVKKEISLKNRTLDIEKGEITPEIDKAVPKKEKIISTREDQKQEQNENAFFIPDFIPKSTVKYDSYKINISNITIYDENKNQVNVLIENNRYTYNYDVEFEESFKNISFGMQIKSEKGQVFIGCSHYLEDKPVDVIKGETYRISFEFDCLFKGGVFYTNCGVSQHKNGEFKFLNRIVDAYVFKVQNKKQICNGLISLKEKFTYEVLKTDDR